MFFVMYFRSAVGNPLQNTCISLHVERLRPSLFLIIVLLFLIAICSERFSSCEWILVHVTIYWISYTIRTNKMHTFLLMVWFNYIVFDMFRTTKYSSSGRLVHAVLWDWTAYMDAWRHTIKLHVQVFLRMKTWMFETCRRQYN
jgi:hypothetical protein